MGQVDGIGHFRSRSLAPSIGIPYSMASGQPQETQLVIRGSRAQVSANGTIVAGGGYPAPIRRTASFATILPGPVPVVNVVTGVPVKALPPKSRRRKR